MTAGNSRTESVTVLGLGGVGSLVADMLVDGGFNVTGADLEVEHSGLARKVSVDAADEAALKELLAGEDAVISCLPYHMNAGVARVAHSLGVHYLDLTEDRPTAEMIAELAKTAEAALIPHCGLAPGFICIAGAALVERFDRPERLALRVGAIPQTPNSELGYAFNWSPAGVVNEYINRCEVLRNGRLTTIEALSEVERLIVDGTQLEAFSTSGGLGTMCESFSGRLDRLDYKTLRYPGHCRLMRFLLDELRLSDDRKGVEEILARAYPPVADDMVVLFAAAEGRVGTRQTREEIARVYRPREVAGRLRTAIAWTTAAGVVGVFELLAAGLLPDRGLIRQEEIPLDALFGTRGGSLLNHGAAEAEAEVRPVPALEHS